jgi:hypothetical protein
VIQDTAPDGNALSDTIAEAKSSMIHASLYAVGSYPLATLILSGTGQTLSDCGQSVQGLTAPRKVTICPASGPMAEW